MSLLSTFTRDPFLFSVDPFATDVFDPLSMVGSQLGLRGQTRSRNMRDQTENPPGINMDFLEDKDGNWYLLEADMPGYDKEDINVSIDNGIVYITALKKELPVEEHGTYFRRERTWGRVSRNMRLPLDCDSTSSKVESKYECGVLKITFPKKVGSSSTSKKLSIK